MSASDDVLLVGHGHPRYGEALSDWADRLRTAGSGVTVVSPSAWYGEEVLEALAEPRDLVVYFGHGVPGAWLGYARLTAESIADVEAPGPHRLVASLCCHALAIPEDDAGLQTAFLRTGLATRFLGHDGEVRHGVNRACLDELLDAYRTALETGEDGVRATIDAAGRSPVRIVEPAAGAGHLTNGTVGAVRSWNLGPGDVASPTERSGSE